MARNIESNRRGYNIRAKLFPSMIDDENEMIIKRDFAKGTVFYAKDHIDFEVIRNEFGGVMQRQIITGFIETMDLEDNQVKVNDTVEYGGKRYNVESVKTISRNQQTEVRIRPIVKTIIKLGAIANG